MRYPSVSEEAALLGIRKQMFCLNPQLRGGPLKKALEQSRKGSDLGLNIGSAT